jgi:hypothetical protein
MTTQTLSMISKAYASNIITEYSNTSDKDSMYDVVHEVADGSEHVIYYDKARELVDSLTYDELNDAEDQAEACFKGEYRSYDDHAVRIAYFALHVAITGALQELMEQQEQQQQEEEEEGDN